MSELLAKLSLFPRGEPLPAIQPPPELLSSLRIHSLKLIVPSLHLDFLVPAESLPLLVSLLKLLLPVGREGTEFFERLKGSVPLLGWEALQVGLAPSPLGGLPYLLSHHTSGEKKEQSEE